MDVDEMREEASAFLDQFVVEGGPGDFGFGQITESFLLSGMAPPGLVVTMLRQGPVPGRMALVTQVCVAVAAWFANREKDPKYAEGLERILNAGDSIEHMGNHGSTLIGGLHPFQAIARLLVSLETVLALPKEKQGPSVLMAHLVRSIVETMCVRGARIAEGPSKGDPLILDRDATPEDVRVRVDLDGQPVFDSHGGKMIRAQTMPTVAGMLDFLEGREPHNATPSGDDDGTSDDGVTS